MHYRRHLATARLLSAAFLLTSGPMLAAATDRTVHLTIAVADEQGRNDEQEERYFLLFLRDPYLTERCSALVTESLSFFSWMRSLAWIPASL